MPNSLSRIENRVQISNFEAHRKRREASVEETNHRLVIIIQKRFAKASEETNEKQQTHVSNQPHCLSTQYCDRSRYSHGRRVSTVVAMENNCSLRDAHVLDDPWQSSEPVTRLEHEGCKACV